MQFIIDTALMQDACTAASSRLDLWPVRMATGETFVLGVDFSKAAARRPIEPERFIEVVGACLSAGAPLREGSIPDVEIHVPPAD